MPPSPFSVLIVADCGREEATLGRPTRPLATSGPMVTLLASEPTIPFGLAWTGDVAAIGALIVILMSDVTSGFPACLCCVPFVEFRAQGMVQIRDVTQARGRSQFFERYMVIRQPDDPTP